jgi:hypothetical protein
VLVPASVQEQLVSELTRHSLGAPFLFEPDSYRKGSAIREPADLAWLCRDTLFLFNMQAGRATCAQQTEHNMSQLHGWLRMWSLGSRLQGANEWQTFDLAIDEVGAIVLLSVVHSADARLEVHPPPFAVPRNKAEARVLARTTVPTSVLLELAHRGGSALDLADLILRVHGLEAPVTEEEALRFVVEHHEAAFARAEAAPEVRRDRDEELYRSVLTMIARGLRTMLKQGVTNGDAMDLDGVATFNDLDWEMTATLALRAADAIRAVRDVPVGEYGPNQLAVTVHLPPYKFVVGAMDIRCGGEFGASLGEALKRMTEESPETPPVSITFQLVGRPSVEFMSSMLTCPAQAVPSLTRQTLEALSGSGITD